MLRYIFSWAASSPDYALATLDVAAAFLNAPLPLGRTVVLRPQSILYKLQLLLLAHVWLSIKPSMDFVRLRMYGQSRGGPD